MDAHQRVILDDGGASGVDAALGSTGNPLSILDGYGAPAALTWTSATTVNTANTINTPGYDGVMISVVTGPSITGGVLVFEVYDGAAWVSAQAGKMNGYGGQTSLTLTANMSLGFQINTAGCQAFRTRISSVITGSGNVVVTHAVSSANMPDPLTVGLDPAQPLPAGSNLLGSVTGVGATISNIPTVTAGASSAGWVVGGIQTLANALPASFNAVLQSLALKFKATAQTGRWAVALFTASPSGTFGDHAAPAIAAGDTALLIGIFPLTAAQSNLGTHTIYQSDGLAHQIDGASTSLYAVVIAVDAPVNPASTSEMTLTAGLLW